MKKPAKEIVNEEIRERDHQWKKPPLRFQGRDQPLSFQRLSQPQMLSVEKLATKGFNKKTLHEGLQRKKHIIKVVNEES